LGTNNVLRTVFESIWAPVRPSADLSRMSCHFGPTSSFWQCLRQCIWCCHNPYVKITYTEESKVREFFVALDTADLREMSETLDRADLKEKSLRALLDDAGVPYLNVED